MAWVRVGLGQVGAGFKTGLRRVLAWLLVRTVVVCYCLCREHGALRGALPAAPRDGDARAGSGGLSPHAGHAGAAGQGALRRFT